MRGTWWLLAVLLLTTPCTESQGQTAWKSQNYPAAGDTIAYRVRVLDGSQRLIHRGDFTANQAALLVRQLTSEASMQDGISFSAGDDGSFAVTPKDEQQNDENGDQHVFTLSRDQSGKPSNETVSRVVTLRYDVAIDRHHLFVFEAQTPGEDAVTQHAFFFKEMEGGFVLNEDDGPARTQLQILFTALQEGRIIIE